MEEKGGGCELLIVRICEGTGKNEIENDGVSMDKHYC